MTWDVRNPLLMYRRSDREEHRMRRIRYSVAMSLDGYIAGPNGEYDWIELDPSAGAAISKRSTRSSIPCSWGARAMSKRVAP